CVNSCQSVLDRCLFLQIYGSPGTFWEKELESLITIAEIKNKDVCELGYKLKDMEMMEEKNQILEKRLSTVLQQNEELTARVEQLKTLVQ
uniref:Uncharacterized protein n=1 Tax=Erpetoichthys calabaricus TaxID=27687 RepID=A0A8C4RF93_ERPCA